MSLLLRNRQRDERFEELRELLNLVLDEGDAGRAEIEGRLAELHATRHSTAERGEGVQDHG